MSPLGWIFAVSSALSIERAAPTASEHLAKVNGWKCLMGNSWGGPTYLGNFLEKRLYRVFHKDELILKQYV